MNDYQQVSQRESCWIRSICAPSSLSSPLNASPSIEVRTESNFEAIKSESVGRGTVFSCHVPDDSVVTCVLQFGGVNCSQPGIGKKVVAGGVV